MAASISAIRGAWAAIDGDDDVAARHWADTLKAAATHDYLLLVCDALEAFADVASRRAAWTQAGQLLAAAARLREEITYRFRFSFEQAAIERALTNVAAAAPEESLVTGRQAPIALAWRDAANLALQTHA
jgi:hypothetical protein